MCSYLLSHLGDEALVRDLAALVARDRATTAELLAHLAEVDARKLYLPAAYPSMYAYCVHELHMSEDAACRRIRAARVARQFPAIFAAVAEGRLHLSAVVLLAPFLTPENANELLAAAAHQNRSELEQLLAQRFPQPDVPALVQAISPAPTVAAEQLSTGTVEASAPARMESPAPPPKVKPLAPERFALQVTIGQSTYEKLQYAQALLGHQAGQGELATTIDRAFDALIERLEKRKFAATSKPRSRRARASAHRRHIPAHVKRTVWERDGGRCTFVSEAGRHCPARTGLEYDHIDPVARGGQATVGGIRLRCRAHNQHAAECGFGAEFMRHKREEAGRARDRALAAGRVTQLAPERVEARAPQPNDQPGEGDVVPWLRALGFNADEARRAAARCEAIPDASLEERLRLALSCLRPAHRVDTRGARAT